MCVLTEMFQRSAKMCSFRSRINFQSYNSNSFARLVYKSYFVFQTTPAFTKSQKVRQKQGP